MPTYFSSRPRLEAYFESVREIPDEGAENFSGRVTMMEFSPEFLNRNKTVRRDSSTSDGLSCRRDPFY